MSRTAIHPGEHLAEQLQALDMSAAELGRQLKVPTNRITEILNGQRSITGDTALRLGHFFGTSAQFWLNLQALYTNFAAFRGTGAAKLATRASLPRKISSVTSASESCLRHEHARLGLGVSRTFNREYRR